MKSRDLYFSVKFSFTVVRIGGIRTLSPAITGYGMLLYTTGCMRMSTKMSSK